MADFRTQFEEIGQAFVKHYYNMFDNPETRTNNLISLYLVSANLLGLINYIFFLSICGGFGFWQQEQCFQTFEGGKSAGVEQIKARLAVSSHWNCSYLRINTNKYTF